MKKVIDDEIMSTIFVKKSCKVPRPDGVTTGFFKAAWALVENDVVAAMRSIFLVW